MKTNTILFFIFTILTTSSITYGDCNNAYNIAGSNAKRGGYPDTLKKISNLLIEAKKNDHFVFDDFKDYIYIELKKGVDK